MSVTNAIKTDTITLAITNQVYSSSNWLVLAVDTDNIINKLAEVKTTNIKVIRNIKLINFWPYFSTLTKTHPVDIFQAGSDTATKDNGFGKESMFRLNLTLNLFFLWK